MKKFKIGKIIIDNSTPPVVIAEIGINHNGNLDRAISIADKAILSGAEIIKHQTHIVDEEMSEEAKKTVPGNSKLSIYEIMKLPADTQIYEIMKYISKLLFLIIREFCTLIPVLRVLKNYLN